jgi:hypothetical protein
MTPPAWDILAEELWHLSPHESRTLWHAIAHSRWARPVARARRSTTAQAEYVRPGCYRFCRDRQAFLKENAYAQRPHY